MAQLDLAPYFPEGAEQHNGAWDTGMLNLHSLKTQRVD